MNKASRFLREQSRWRRGDWFIRIEGNQEKKKRERREEGLEREGQGGEGSRLGEDSSWARQQEEGERETEGGKEKEKRIF